MYFNNIEEAILLLKSNPATSTSLNWFISSSSVQLKFITFFLVINAFEILCISFKSSSLKFTSTSTSFGDIFDTSSKSVVFNSLKNVVLNSPVDISEEAIP